MRRTHPIKLLGAAALSLSLLACGKGGGEPSPAPSPAAPGPTATSSPETSDDAAGSATAPTPATAKTDAAPALTLARVGDRVITADDVSALLAARHGDEDEAPTPTVLRGAVDQLVDTALLAEEARAQGFSAEVQGDAALVAAYLDDKLTPELKAAVTVDEIAIYWNDRRRAAHIEIAKRSVASQAQATMLKAIEALPDKADEIFADFYQQFDVKEQDALSASRGTKIPFDRAGRSATGEIIVPLHVAGAAFALDKIGAVSPPVTFGDKHWALVQLRGIHPGVPAADLTQAQLAEARGAIAAAHLSHQVDALLERLRGGDRVHIDGAAIAALSKRLLAKGDRTPREGPAGRHALPFNVRKWRRDRFNGRRETKVITGKHDPEQLRKFTDEERLEKARKNMPDGGL